MAGIATALILSPVAAQAYEADDYTVGVSETTPVAGETFTVTIDGPAGNPTIALTVSSDAVPDSAITIAGSRTLVKDTDANGDATFAVTLTQPATYTIVATDADGTVISTQTVQVLSSSAAGGSGDAGSGAAGSGDAAGSSGSGSWLPATGASTVPLAIGAGALVAGGGVLLLMLRKQRSAKA
ncbi:LPXTG cell wall anchor domain-containing protein [Oerskovia flava]|uniref:LPXTG cell wall anchor domain-containing protein n=1 Tax=Oerskovia flava TaxID=2986422 RepID=UPI00223EC10F|nr:LPXTG cell wall anchor domain-containing protein [Oerskovia sp. JB1-3-2]